MSRPLCLAVECIALVIGSTHGESHHHHLRALAPPPAGNVLEARFERPYVPSAEEVAAGRKTAILQAQLATLMKEEASHVARFHTLSEENYTKLVAAALPAVEAETSSSTAHMLGEMRKDMFRFAGPFYKEVVLKRIQDNRAEQAVVRHQLAILNATVQVDTKLPVATAPQTHPVPVAPSQNSPLIITVLAVLVLIVIGGGLFVLMQKRGRERAEAATRPQTITVSIIKGTELLNVDGLLAGKSDPFCTCHVVGRPINEKLKTKCLDNNSNPVWDFTGKLQNITASDNLEFEVWDKNAFKSDKFIGKVMVAAGDFFEHGGCEGDLALVGTKGKAAGSISVRIQCELQPSVGRECF